MRYTTTHISKELRRLADAIDDSLFTELNWGALIQLILMAHSDLKNKRED